MGCRAVPVKGIPAGMGAAHLVPVRKPGLRNSGESVNYFKLLAVLSQRMPPSSKFHDQKTLVTVPPIWSSRI